MIDDPVDLLRSSLGAFVVSVAVTVYNWHSLATRLDADDSNIVWLAIGGAFTFCELITIVICIVLILRRRPR